MPVKVLLAFPARHKKKNLPHSKEKENISFNPVKAGAPSTISNTSGYMWSQQFEENIKSIEKINYPTLSPLGPGLNNL